MDAARHIMAFDAAADRALQRVTLRRWLGLSASTMRWAVAAVVLSVGAQWLGWVGNGLPFAMVAIWLGGCAFWAWRHRPGKYEALALWDEARQASEAFAAAWWYGSLAERTRMQQRHVDVQAAALDAALPGLAHDLPLQMNRWVWLAPALACLGMVGNWYLHRMVPEEQLSDSMRQAAVAEAKNIAQTDWQKKKLQGLTEQEKKDIEKLKLDIKTTAGDLQSETGQSARDVLNNLEKRAREAEKLAQRLGTEAGSWASEKLVNELRRHADTADLGDAVADKNAAQTAKTAADLAAQLKSPQATPEFKERLGASLKEVRKQSEAEDRKRVVGSHVIAAGEELDLGKAAEAGLEFEKLAGTMQDLARREQSRKELEKLAQQLRDAGSRIAGNKGGGMQQMAGTGQNGQQSQQGQAGQGTQQMQGQQAMTQAPLQPPGLAQNAPQTIMQEAPEPGTNQQQQQGMAQMRAGQPPPGQGKPMLIAPVPGMKMDKPPQALILGKDPAKPTDGPSITINVPGGQQPGNGTAKLDNTPTAAKKAAGDSQVNAVQGNEGQSTSRSVEGGIRQEGAGRNAQQTAVDFIQQQEEALDESSLPPARREQVRRYFTELRKRFEEKK